jgi:hypothetical protein
VTTPLQQRRRVESARAWAWFTVVLGVLMITFNLLMMVLTSSWNGVWAQLGFGVILTILAITTLKKNPKPQGPDPAPQRTPAPDRSPGKNI